VSELQPRAAQIGDWYRTAIGLRLLPVGSVIRNGSHMRRCWFLKVAIDGWAFADSSGLPQRMPDGGHIGTAVLPLRSEQLWLPAMLQKIGEPKQ
jgi:hypothetical protein